MLFVSERPAWPAFKTAGDIDAIAEDIPALDDDVALVNTHPVIDPLRPGGFGIALSHLGLHFGRTAQCVHHAAELGQKAIACCFYESAAMLSEFTSAARIAASRRSARTHPPVSIFVVST